MDQSIDELLVSAVGGLLSRRDVLGNVFPRDGGDPVYLRREGDHRRDEGQWVPTGGERPFGGAAEEESGLGENCLRLVFRSAHERGRLLHGVIERGGVVEGGDGWEIELCGDAGDKVGEGVRGAEGGLSGLREGEGEVVGPRDEQGAGGGEGGEEGGARGGEVATGGGFRHLERLLGAGPREAKPGGDGDDGLGGGGELVLAVRVVGVVAD